MNEEVNNTDGFMNEMTMNKTNRKNRRPEMARYQPPNSRLNTSNNSETSTSATVVTNNKQETIETKSETPKVTSQNERIHKTTNGGIIKLNQNALNEIINKNEKLSLSENTQDLSVENQEKERHLVVNSNRLQSNESRTLFDPNNPDKPILVDLKTRHPTTPRGNPKKVIENKRQFIKYFYYELEQFKLFFLKQRH